jgi:hypothetical protein
MLLPNFATYDISTAICTRILDLPGLSKQRSLFLLGPSQTGKSTLLRHTFPDARYVDLLEANTFRELSAFPETLRQSLKPTEGLIIIDEVQKLPALLDEVQALTGTKVCVSSSQEAAPGNCGAAMPTCSPAELGFAACIRWSLRRSDTKSWSGA